MLLKWIFEFTSSLNNVISDFQIQFLSEPLVLQTILHVSSYDYSVCCCYALCTQ